MFEENTILAIITARGGSRGIPRKNLREIGNKPMLAWSIQAAQKSRFIDRLILSSEDIEVIETAKKFGCEVPFKRPHYLATDDAESMDVVHHALNALPEKYDYLILLQPTSPFCSAQDIDGCLEILHKEKAPSAVTVFEVDKHPNWMYSFSKGSRIQPLIEGEKRTTRRQDLPRVFALNGAVFIARCDWVASQRDFISPETVAYEMPKNRSIDIDTENDLLLANLLAKEFDNKIT
jgi:CMP-N,N'-diacetyllegionaminic acid synthase